MGIKDLWTVLTPYFERKPLYELQGKSVAIDLSCWVCEAQNVAEYQVQPRMYLRNLYFRTAFLLLLDVRLVFVLEGKAPELKQQVMAARNLLQFKGQKPRAAPSDGSNHAKGAQGGRNRFQHTLRQCQEMLRLMGLACVTAQGEAEAACAYLNRNRLVDGCISQDSDCFAYGAQVVYRNFSISHQGPFAASGGAVDVYDISKAKSSIDFGRNKVIAMALLCGSDYSDGIHGVGKDSVMKLFEKVADEEILERLRSWHGDKPYAKWEKELTDKTICTSCGHPGKVQSHKKLGCGHCYSSSGCDDSFYKDERLAMKNELSMRTKALVDPAFPNDKLIQEFLAATDTITSIDLQWKQPDLIKFVEFTVKYLEWEQLYAFEKLFPIVTRWQIVHHNKLNKLDSKLLYPDSIKKVRNPKGIASYEIIWIDRDKHFNDLIPQEQLENVDVIKLYSTVEPQVLVRDAYPDIVLAFEQSKIKPKRKATSKRKKASVKDITDMLANTSITAPPKAKVKRAARKKEIDETLGVLQTSFDEMTIKEKPLESYFRAAVHNSMQKNVSSAPLASSSMDNLFDRSCFGDENDDCNLSGVVDRITNSSKPEYIEKNWHHVINKISKQPEIAITKECNKSLFFKNILEENDLFEKSIKIDLQSRDGEDSDQNENVECDEQIEDKPNHEAESDDDSFCIVNIPLKERIAARLK